MMKHSNALRGTAQQAARLVVCPATTRPFLLTRFYATQHGLGATAHGSSSRKRTVTPFNDDGFVPWSELSTSEKAARATQQSVNFGMIIVGFVLTASLPLRLEFRHLLTATLERCCVLPVDRCIFSR